MSDLSHVPSGYHSVTPSLTVKDAGAALAFYQAAFGAVEHYRLPDKKTGGIAHAEFSIGDCKLMISDEYPAFGAVAPEIAHGCLFMIYVADIEAAFIQAVDAGGIVTFPPTDQFYGDRTARLNDPFGYRWTLAQRVKDISVSEMNELMAEW
ncbi:MAG: VOC family protein [Prosthecobacter sp.]|nr:VOC family protein [Prosthecobacter sp.]